MFFIFDCNGQIVGNTKGYKTHKGAQAQCNLDKSKPTKVMALLWDRFHARAQIDATKTRIYSIRWVDQPKSEAAIAFDEAFNNPVEFMKKHFTIIHVH
jgi:hypothetical protein